MRYLIIGLGIYGSNLARDLTAMGHEVIGADIKAAATNAMKDYISAVYILDATNDEALDVLPLKNSATVIVAIGENFGASVRTVALLKAKGVEHIYARAGDPLHYAILQSFNIDRILTPEQRAAADLANEMMLGAHVRTLTIDPETVILKMDAPDTIIGDRYADLKFDREGITLIAVTRAWRTTNILHLDVDEQHTIDFHQDTVHKGDILTCMGSRHAFRSLMKNLNR